MCVAGEASGDLHGGHLVEEIYRLLPEAHIYGMGMTRMRSAGAEILIDSTPLAVMGWTQVITHLPALKQAYNRLKAAIQKDPPDLLIIIDYPTMGIKLARFARKYGVRVMYYIAPKIWASRPKRISQIKRYVNQMAVIFPFEEDLYRKAGIPVRYVGNPVVADMQKESPESPGKNLDIPTTGKPAIRRTILLLPGSRSQEIKSMLPVLCRTAQLIRKQLIKQNTPLPPRYVLLLAPGANEEYVRKQITAHDIECEVTAKTPYRVMREASLALAVSGTVTLQLGLCQTPMLVIYKTGILTYLPARYLIKIPHISLVNIIGQREIVPEFIQFSAKPERLCAAAMELLNKPGKAKKMRKHLTELRLALGTENSAVNTAKLARDMLLS